MGIVVFENKEVTEITSSKAPYLTSLANQYTRLSNMFGIRHPSLPNYLAMIGGSTFGITNDCTSCHVNATNLVDQLEAAGFSWKAYMEDAPGPCPTIGNNGSYYKKHDPFMYFDDIANNPARCNKVVPYTQLKTDLANHFLPDFFFITPNICHDMHNCSIATGDTWAKNNLPQVINALGTNGILFVTFDEGSTNAGCCGNAAGGHIYTAIVGPGAKTSNVVTTAVDHYSMLRLVEDQFGVAHLRNAATAPAINGALK